MSRVSKTNHGSAIEFGLTMLLVFEKIDPIVAALMHKVNTKKGGVLLYWKKDTFSREICLKAYDDPIY